MQTKNKSVYGFILIIGAILPGKLKTDKYADEPCYCKEVIAEIKGVVSKSTVKMCKERNGEIVSFEEYLDYLGIQ